MVKPDKPDETKVEKKIVREYRFVHSESECSIKQSLAYLSGCVDEKALKALQVLHGMPVCLSDQKFSHWEACDHKALREIRSVLDKAEHCDAEPNPNCEWVTLEFKQKKGSSLSEGQRILLLEDRLEHLALTRYSSRMLDILEVDSEGNYRTSPASFRLPKPMKTILVDILDADYPWMSPRSLATAAGVYRDKFGSTVRPRSLIHGNHILNQLAEMNPNAEFVIASTASKEATVSICEAHKPGWRAKYRDYERNKAKTLREFVLRNRINYVNMSFGDSLDELREKITRGCGTARDLPSDIDLIEAVNIALEEFYLPLSSLDGVIVVQAAGRPKQGTSSFDLLDPSGSLIPFAQRSMTHSTKEVMADCAKLPHRLRVAGFGAVNPGFGPEGVHTSEETRSAGAPEFIECIDVALSNGFHDPLDDKWNTPIPPEDLVFSLWQSSDAIESSPGGMGCSSEAVPLAISYLIALKRDNPSFTTKQLLAHATRGGKYKDPLRHELSWSNVFGSDAFKAAWPQ